jgi:hypothetical protein
MPRFRLFTVLVLTALFAIALLALVRPSVVWLIILPPLTCIALVFAAIRAITTPRERTFWLGLIVGLTAYGGCVLFVELTAVIGGPQTVSSTVGAWAWEYIHGTDPSQGRPQRFRNLEVVSFCISLYVVVGTLISFVATLLAQYVMRIRD